MGAFLRKYGTATHIYIPLIKRGVVDFAIGTDFTPAAGDVKVSIDGGSAANIGTLPSAVTMGNTAYWDFTIATGEVTGKKIVVTVADSSTKVVEDQSFLIETYGHASAEYPPDFSDGMRIGLTALPNAAAEASGGLPTRGTGTGQIALTSGAVTVGTNNDKTGYTASTVSDKTGYSLTNLTVSSGVTLASGTHNPQTGDSYARIGATGSGLTSLAPSSTALSTATWSGTRAGYLDNLSGGAVALASALAIVDGIVDTIVLTTSKLDDTLEDDGGTFRFTGNALEEAPSGGGGGGDATEAKQDIIIAALAVVDGIVDDILVDTGTTIPGTLTTLQAGVNDVPTNSEMATAFAAADDVTLAAIGSLNNLSASQVWANGTRTLTSAANITSTGGTTVPQTGDAYTALTTAVPDSIPADGSRPSVQQALYMLAQLLTESAIVGTTWTIKKPDGSTTLFTLTLDDAGNPTSKTRAT